MRQRIIPAGFILAGAINILGIFLVSHGLQSDTLPTADPAVFSRFGLLAIMLWGLAYISTARHAETLILLPATFALEKLAYTINWALWIPAHGGALPDLIEQDLLGGLFLSGYGLNDALFFVFFAGVAWRNWRLQRRQAR